MFQFWTENVCLMKNALNTLVALIDFAKILARYPSFLVERRPCAAWGPTNQYVNVLKAGQAIHISYVINVRKYFTNLNEIHAPLFFIELLSLSHYQIFFSDECETNNDCPLTKKCFSHECRDPCQYISCGKQALCRAENHGGVCYCPPGKQGNPLVECVDVGCVLDTDCNDDERCNRKSGKCLTLCSGPVCAQGAHCSATNHREICTCSPPLTGDGYVYCTEGKIYVPSL